MTTKEILKVLENLENQLKCTLEKMQENSKKIDELNAIFADKGMDNDT